MALERENFYTTSQAMEKLDVPRSTLLYLGKRGVIQSITLSTQSKESNESIAYNDKICQGLEAKESKHYRQTIKMCDNLRYYC